MLFGGELPKNTWIHLVTVVDYSACQLRLYMDNALEDTDSLITFDLSAAGSLGAFIGLGGAWGGPQYGPIDDVAIYNRALSSSEINELYLIPTPSAILLGSIGLSVAGMKLRRHKV
jgi:hypothetical protein